MQSPEQLYMGWPDSSLHTKSCKMLQIHLSRPLASDMVVGSPPIKVSLFITCSGAVAEHDNSSTLSSWHSSYQLSQVGPSHQGSCVPLKAPAADDQAVRSTLFSAVAHPARCTPPTTFRKGMSRT